jgi:hypothetical protein
MPYNVLELCLVRFETFSYRNITDKDTMFVAICKAKIIVAAKRPLLQMLCCPPALGKGAVIHSAISTHCLINGALNILPFFEVKLIM